MMFGFLHDFQLLLTAFIYFLALKSITIQLKSNVLQCIIIFFSSPNQKMGKQRKKKKRNELIATLSRMEATL